jgi:hypothetical protein
MPVVTRRPGQHDPGRRRRRHRDTVVDRIGASASRHGATTRTLRAPLPSQVSPSPREVQFRRCDLTIAPVPTRREGPMDGLGRAYTATAQESGHAKAMSRLAS